MKYKVVLERPARKFIQKQPPEQQKRILTALSKLPEQGDIFPMRGRKNQYRVRIGTYRAIYRLEQNVLTVTVLKVDNRGDVEKSEGNKTLALFNSCCLSLSPDPSCDTRSGHRHCPPKSQ